jgi:hypothetical protein
MIHFSFLRCLSLLSSFLLASIRFAVLNLSPCLASARLLFSMRGCWGLFGVKYVLLGLMC